MVNKLKTTTSTFKIIKSSWGIWLQITGESIPNNSNNNQLEIEPKNLNLSKKELDLLRNGFQWVKPIMEKKKLQKRRITIKEIKLIPTDYQEEGLFYGIAFWLSEHFEFEMPKFKYEFNKEKNKYIFPEMESEIN